MKYYWIISLVAIITTGCIEQVDLPQNNITSGRLVVEGEITNEKKAHTIKLTRTNAAIPDDPAQAVSGSVVFITAGGQEKHPLHENDTLPGTYATDTSVQGEIGKTYTLIIQTDGILYTASATIPPPVPFTEPRELFRAPNRLENPIPDNLDVYELQFPKVRFGVTQPTRIVCAAISPIDNTLLQASHYQFPGIDPQGFLLNFQGHNATLTVTEGTEITQTNYAMTTEHETFMRSVFAQTEFKGGLFDRTAANAPTNITNGALGFFAATAVTSRKIIFSKLLLN